MSRATCENPQTPTYIEALPRRRDCRIPFQEAPVIQKGGVMRCRKAVTTKRVWTPLENCSERPSWRLQR